MSRRPLWDPASRMAREQSTDGMAERAPATAPTGAPVAPGGPLPPRSALDASVALARLSALLCEAAEVLRELSEVPLAVPAERALMCSVNEPATTARLLTAEDLAARLQVDARTIRRWRKAGKIPGGIELGDSIIRWPADQIERWLAGGST